ncbi:hypothetical protein [Microcoleus sp. CAWBG58]|uniref:hypothetical protein n=1 Tax=Microcoleus sp. CAWBG58 TaxID=2841651 RepID=UPI0025D72E5F|nr:hypothetical protein [Microcoleus sp. CAWBG58]
MHITLKPDRNLFNEAQFQKIRRRLKPRLHKRIPPLRNEETAGYSTRLEWVLFV